MLAGLANIRSSPPGGRFHSSDDRRAGVYSSTEVKRTEGSHEGDEYTQRRVV